MDFFSHQEAARKRTSLLLFYYVLAVFLLVGATYAAVMIVFFWKGKDVGLSPGSWWHAKIFAGSAIGTVGVILLGSLYRIIELRQGGAAVAEMLGGTPITSTPVDANEQKLRNVVEEMAIASGTPVPEIYVLPDEPGINAFAAGHSVSNAAIGVTRGCIRQLNRDELQGVIAHEFSHILNGDMRMNIRLMGILHGILCLFLVGRVLLRVRSSSSSSRKKGGNPLPLFGLLLMAIGGLGVLFGRLIQAAVSRQREFLADASAVQFTRNPRGITGALKKIGTSAFGSQLEASQASAASHLYFGNGIGESWFGLMATHPPLSDRIRRIEPTFDGAYPPMPVEEITPPPMEPAQSIRMSAAGLAQIQGLVAIPAEQLTQRVGATVEAQYASGLIEAVPDELREAAGNPLSATALMFALVSAHDSTTRAQQLSHVATVDSAVADLATHYATLLENLDRRSRLVLLNLSLTALRTMSRSQWERFRGALDQMVCSDQQIDLFEFVLKRVLERNLDAHFAPRKTTVVQYFSFQPLAEDCAVLLSALAHVGAANEADIRRAFHEGAGRLPTKGALPLMTPESCGVASIDSALSRLAQAIPHIKKSVINACAHTVSCDGEVRAEEAELLRAIAESLDCPIPPFIRGV